MARQSRKIAESGIYQVLLRGDNRLLFIEPSDYECFLKLLSRFSERDYVELYAYCLLPEAVYFAIKEGLSPLNATIKDIASAYAVYFNSKYALSGKLFYDRYASLPLESDEILKEAVHYIHHLPPKQDPLLYNYSSYQNYLKKSGLFSDALLLLFNLSHVDFKMFMSAPCAYSQTFLTHIKAQKMTDEECRTKIKELLYDATPQEIKKLTDSQFKKVIATFKKIEGVSVRQLSRVLNLSRDFIAKCE